MIIVIWIRVFKNVGILVLDRVGFSDLDDVFCVFWFFCVGLFSGRFYLIGVFFYKCE